MQPEQRRLHLDRIRQTFLPSSVCSVTTSVLVIRVFESGNQFKTRRRMEDMHKQTKQTLNKKGTNMDKDEELT